MSLSALLAAPSNSSEKRVCMHKYTLSLCLLPSVKDFRRTKPSPSQKTHFCGSTEQCVLVQHPYSHLDRSCLLMQTRLQQNGCTIPVKVDSKLFVSILNIHSSQTKSLLHAVSLLFFFHSKCFQQWTVFQHKGNNFLRSGLDSVQEVGFDFGRSKPQSETEMLR